MSGLLSPTKISEKTDPKASEDSFKIYPIQSPNADFEVISEESNSVEIN